MSNVRIEIENRGGPLPHFLARVHLPSGLALFAMAPTLEEVTALAAALAASHGYPLSRGPDIFLSVTLKRTVGGTPRAWEGQLYSGGKVLLTVQAETLREVFALFPDALENGALRGVL